MGWEESLIQVQLNSHPFPGRMLAAAISIKHSGMLYQLVFLRFIFMSHCCFFSDFRPLEIY